MMHAPPQQQPLFPLPQMMQQVMDMGMDHMKHKHKRRRRRRKHGRHRHHDHEMAGHRRHRHHDHPSAEEDKKHHVGSSEQQPLQVEDNPYLSSDSDDDSSEDYSD
eukprot:CAMPEP_0117431684 /NCGR_PEP_ID=MMETSP0758-20121206/11216_1 /TAXON_ID=63605 /ORGANISM="Percolomonas cosmopolitus, Strain AE-1 (ATCC 50343)" /LENGTH=104 /DNA_ID=CAMNT_0005220935 /DNA_START=179 /DNA_END=493 /DNA_ORIENTATION=+